MRRLSRFLIAVFALTMVSSAHAETPLDVVGIKIGMSPEQALEALRAYSPLMVSADNAFGPPRIARVQFRGLPPMIHGIKAQAYTHGRLELPETIELEVVPGPKPMVVSIYRDANSPRKEPLAYTNVMAALKQKYGVHATMQVGDILVWYYDADGRPMQRKPGVCHPNANNGDRSFRDDTPQPPMVFRLQQLNTPGDTVKQLAQACGSYVQVQINPIHQRDIASRVTTFASNETLRAAQYHALDAVLAKNAEQLRQKDVGEAAKRGGGKY